MFKQQSLKNQPKKKNFQWACHFNLNFKDWQRIKRFINSDNMRLDFLSAFRLLKLLCRWRWYRSTSELYLNNQELVVHEFSEAQSKETDLTRGRQESQVGSTIFIVPQRRLRVFFHANCKCNCRKQIQGRYFNCFLPYLHVRFFFAKTCLGTLHPYIFVYIYLYLFASIYMFFSFLMWATEGKLSGK